MSYQRSTNEVGVPISRTGTYEQPHRGRSPDRTATERMLLRVDQQRIANESCCVSAFQMSAVTLDDPNRTLRLTRPLPECCPRRCKAWAALECVDNNGGATP
jgi:hypothetical protein